MRALLTLLLIVCVQTVRADPTEVELLDALKKRAPDKFVALRQNEKADAPIVGLFGDLADAPADGKQMHGVRDFVQTYGSLLGYPAGGWPAEFSVPDFISPTGGSLSLVFVPNKDGKIWPGGAVGFHFDRDKKLVAVTSRYKKMGAVGAGNLDAAAAVQKALESLRQKHTVELSSDGVLWQFLGEADDGSLKPLYRVEVVVGEGGVPVQVLLDASGTVLCTRAGGHRFDADGLAYDGYPVTADNLREPMKRLDDVLSGRKHYPLVGEVFRAKSSAYNKARSTNGHFEFPTSFVMTFDSGTKRRLSHPRYLETSMYFHLMQAYDKAMALGAKELDVPFEDGSTAKPVITFDPWTRPDDMDRGSTVDNAYYKHADKGMHFAWYNPSYEFRQAAADPSVIYHEYGHAVHYRLNPFWTGVTFTPQELGDSGAIGEGFADYFSMLVSGGSSTAEIFLGSKDARHASLTPDYCHLVPIYDSADVECNVEKGGTTEIHPAGQLFSGLAMRLTQSGKEQLGKDEAESATRVFEAMRITFPTTFRQWALSVMAVQMRSGDATKLPALVALWREAGLFKECGK